MNNIKKIHHSYKTLTKTINFTINALQNLYKIYSLLKYKLNIKNIRTNTNFLKEE